MDVMHREQYGKRHEASIYSPGYNSPQTSTCFPTRNLSKLCPFEFLWRCHDLGTGGGECDRSFQLSGHMVGPPGNHSASLDTFQKSPPQNKFSSS